MYPCSIHSQIWSIFNFSNECWLCQNYFIQWYICTYYWFGDINLSDKLSIVSEKKKKFKWTKSIPEHDHRLTVPLISHIWDIDHFIRFIVNTFGSGLELQPNQTHLSTGSPRTKMLHVALHAFLLSIVQILRCNVVYLPVSWMCFASECVLPVPWMCFAVRGTPGLLVVIGTLQAST